MCANRKKMHYTASEVLITENFHSKMGSMLSIDCKISGDFC